MMLFNPEVGELDRKAGRGQGHNECYSETEKPKWGMLPGDQRKFTLPERLESNK
jgi:hypothetical protein